MEEIQNGPGTNEQKQEAISAMMTFEPTFENIYQMDLARVMGSGSTEPPAWRMQGADLSDYFNYGFDEQTWVAFCAFRAQRMRAIQRTKEDPAIMGPSVRF